MAAQSAFTTVPPLFSKCQLEWGSFIEFRCFRALWKVAQSLSAFCVARRCSTESRFRDFFVVDFVLLVFRTVSELDTRASYFGNVFRCS